MVEVLDRWVSDVPVSAGSDLRLHDIGPLVLRVDGVSAPVPGFRPKQVLSALLVHANRRVSVDTLLDALWGDQASESTLGTLETHIWRLRKIMEPGRGRRAQPTYLVNDGGGYRLIVNPDAADSLRFVQLAEQGDRLLASGDPERARERYESALGLWRGRPFDAVADEQWAAGPIARLDELYGQVNEQYIEALLRIGSQARAISELEAMTGRLPFRERLWRQLMLGLYQDGRVEEALATYGRAREILLDTLGLEPGVELCELQQRILNQDPALSAPAGPASIPRTAPDTSVIHLPSRLSPLIGRGVELEQLRRLVARNSLVTLVGAAGCGKTRLAIDSARAAAHSAPDGVWFVDLAAVEDPDAVPDVVMATIGMAQPPVGAAAAALRSYVRDHEMLLLIDNCEHVLSAVHHLFDTLLNDDSQCRVLATSREPTGFDGEVLWTLAPLETRTDLAGSANAAPSAAARLFVSRAERVDPLFDPTSRALGEIEAICAAVDGLPLAVELAVGRLRSASLPEIRRQVETQLGSLSAIEPARAEHHRTIEKSIEWSVRLLNTDEQTVHARLSVLPGFFTVEAAAAVAGSAPLRPMQVPDLLTRLAHRSLLGVVPGDQDGQATRFRQLATVRSHAAAALDSAGETDAAVRRRASFIQDLGFARPAEYAEDTDNWYGTLADNHDTLTAVLRNTLVIDPDPIGASIMADSAHYWFYRGHVAEGSRWLEAALHLADVPRSVHAFLELTLATNSAQRGRTDLSVRLARSAVDNFDGAVNHRALAFVLLTTLWCTRIRNEDALDHLADEIRRLSNGDPMIDLWAELGDLRTIAFAESPARVGQLAGELAERAADTGNLSAAWLASWHAGHCALLAGDLDAGPDWVHRGDEYHRRIGGGPVPDSAELLAHFAALAGDDQQAVTLFSRASRMAFRTGVPWPDSSSTAAVLARLRTALPPERFDSAWRTGDTTVDQPGSTTTRRASQYA